MDKLWIKYAIRHEWTNYGLGIRHEWTYYGLGIRHEWTNYGLTYAMNGQIMD